MMDPVLAFIIIAVTVAFLLLAAWIKAWDYIVENVYYVDGWWYFVGAAGIPLLMLSLWALMSLVFGGR